MDKPNLEQFPIQHVEVTVLPDMYNVGYIVDLKLPVGVTLVTADTSKLNVPIKSILDRTGILLGALWNGDYYSLLIRKTGRNYEAVLNEQQDEQPGIAEA